MKTKTFTYLFEEGTKDGSMRDPEEKIYTKVEKAATQMNQAGVEVDV